MYNSFIYEKTQRSQRLQESETRHTSYENKRHKGRVQINSGVRNQLAEKYSKRV